MSPILSSTDRWKVAPAAGQAPPITARAPGLQIHLLGRPEGFTAEEIEGWISSLAAAAREGAGAATPDDSLPPVLRHALGGLLFSHSELWGRATDPPCSIVLVQEHGRVAFGWVGEARVEAYEGDTLLAPEWSAVRNPQGQEARAWAAGEDAAIRFRVFFPEASTQALEVDWPGREAPAPAGGTMSSIPMDQAPPPFVVTHPVPQEDHRVAPPSTGVARWLAQHLGFGSGGQRPAPDPAPVASDVVPVELPPSVPDQIPPTPEPGWLTEQAAAVSHPVDDPRAIQLPRSDSGPDAAEKTASIEWDAPGRTAAPDLGPPDTVEPAAPVASDQATVPALLPAESSDAAPLVSAAPVLEVEPMASLPVADEPVPVDETPGSAEEPAMETPQRPRRPWPTGTEPRRPFPLLGWTVGGGIVIVLFLVGWWVGSGAGQRADSTQSPSAWTKLVRAVGLGGARFEARVTSVPAGALIAVDGKDTGLRAPATLELSPGEHRVELSFPDLGGMTYTVRGEHGQQVPLEGVLSGSIEVAASDPESPVSVSVDGEPRGFAPLTLESIAPGAHELRFTGPGMASWGTTVEVRVGEVREVLAYPLQSPATGLLQVRAVRTAEGQNEPLNGARVIVDGQARGVTPLTLELARGPHSVRVEHQGEQVPVQVLDLPGGNQRFATFEFGLGHEYPLLTLRAPAMIPADEPVLVSATLTRVPTEDVTEMWLHVRGGEGRWRRYEMTLLGAQGGAVGAAPFPVALLGPEGSAPYYVSAITSQGDEHFTEMQVAQLARAVRPAGAPTTR